MNEKHMEGNLAHRVIEGLWKNAKTKKIIFMHYISRIFGYKIHKNIIFAKNANNENKANTFH